MRQDYDGLTLVDSAGERVGDIQRSYLEDSGAVRYVEVKLGFFNRHHLVPADRGEISDDTLQVPYLRDVIEESPTISAGDTLEGSDLRSVQEYYAHDFGAADAETSSVEDAHEVAEADNENEAEEPPAITSDERNRPASDYGDATVETEQMPANLGAIRDLGDVIEVPIVEEVLVKKPVVREVLRIRKSQLTEQGTAAADLRRESVEVVPSTGGLMVDEEAAHES